VARHVGIVVGVAHTAVAGYRDLSAIEVDVATYQRVFGSTYELKTVPSATATVNIVHGAIVGLHDVLEPGDTFLFAYSGHGAQRPGLGVDEPDRAREALVLADGEYPDVLLRNALHGFTPGVRVVALVDACHAAGATFIEAPRPARHGLVWQRAKPVPGASSLTLAAAPEDALAVQRHDSGGLLTACLALAHDDGRSKGTWGGLWDAMSAWAIGYDYHPRPQAWLDGPEGSGDELLRAAITG
jgi:hypothetical protein